MAIAAAVLAPAFPYHPSVDALRRHFASAFGLKPSTHTPFPGAHSAFLVAKGWRDQEPLMHPGAQYSAYEGAVGQQWHKAPAV